MQPHTVPCFGSAMENPAHRGVHFSGIRQTEKIPLDVTKKEQCEGGGNPTAASRDRRWWHGVGGMQLNTQCSIHGAPRGTGAIPGLDVNRGPLSTSPDSCRTACRKDSPPSALSLLGPKCSGARAVFFPLSFCFFRFPFPKNLLPCTYWGNHQKSNSGPCFCTVLLINMILRNMPPTRQESHRVKMK